MVAIAIGVSPGPSSPETQRLAVDRGILVNDRLSGAPDIYRAT